MDQKIQFALENTVILKHPKKFLSTFESTIVHYYILTIPFYLEFEGRNDESETIIREGRISWQKPKLITPNYMLRLEGFSEEAIKAFKILAGENSDLAMMLYKLKFVRECDRMDFVSSSLPEVTRKIESDIEKRQDPFSAIIKGVDDYWDVSLSKFIYELALSSAYNAQFPDFARHNLLGLNPMGSPVLSKDTSGIPNIARKEIENFFQLYEKGEIEAKKLKEEIDRWNLFDYYQDTFFNIIKKKK